VTAQKRFQFQVSQDFSCTYEVEAETAEEAWSLLMDSDPTVECTDQVPGDITTTFDSAYAEELED
jgi:hypothetical protein